MASVPPFDPDHGEPAHQIPGAVRHGAGCRGGDTTAGRGRDAARQGNLCQEPRQVDPPHGDVELTARPDATARLGRRCIRVADRRALIAGLTPRSGRPTTPGRRCRPPPLAHPDPDAWPALRRWPPAPERDRRMPRRLPPAQRRLRRNPHHPPRTASVLDPLAGSSCASPVPLRPDGARAPVTTWSMEAPTGELAAAVPAPHTASAGSAGSPSGSPAASPARRPG